MWMSVDRYLAVRKPLRYDTVQTKTRCQCWMVFTWISSAMLCCPPLLGFYKPLYDKEAHICMLDWGNMAAYTVTLAILVSDWAIGSDYNLSVKRLGYHSNKWFRKDNVRFCAKRLSKRKTIGLIKPLKKIIRCLSKSKAKLVRKIEIIFFALFHSKIIKMKIF